MKTTIAALAIGLAALLPRGASALHVALESDAAPGTCQLAPGDVFERATSILTGRGHTVRIVAAADIDTLAELRAFDVVVFGGGNFTCGWEWATFDTAMSEYVLGGGGLVMTGWGAYFLSDNPRAETYAGIESVLPVLKGPGYAAAGSIDVVAGHPITEGVSAFASPDFNSYGGGTVPGATVLIRQGGIDSGAAASFGEGRSVYLGPIYLANWAGYVNEALLDGTSPDAERLFVQAVEWAAGPAGETEEPAGCSCGPGASVPGWLVAWGIVAVVARTPVRRRPGVNRS